VLVCLRGGDPERFTFRFMVWGCGWGQSLKNAKVSADDDISTYLETVFQGGASYGRAGKNLSASDTDQLNPWKIINAKVWALNLLFKRTAGTMMTPRCRIYAQICML
jgi:hypothetical protein